MMHANEPILSFRSHGVLYYETPVDKRSRLLQSQAFLSNASKLQSRERYKGIVTPAVKKRMRKVITLLLQSTPWTYSINPVTQKVVSHKLSFVTLTTPTHPKSYDAKHCHKELLEPLLRHLRLKYHMKSYIWKCELQENKQIHYHVTCDVVIHHRELRDYWNKLLDKHGMLDDFQKEYGHKDPNSTDIHAVHKVDNLEAYLVKYICKEYQNEDAINGKIWDCSKNLKAADYFKIQLDTPIHDFIREAQNSLRVVTTYFERAISLDFRTTDYYAYFSNNIIDQFYTHLKAVRDGTISKLYEKFKESFNKSKQQLWQSNANTQMAISATRSTTQSQQLIMSLTG